MTRILFENLDPLVGIPVSLDPDALARKMVDGGRGGYCYEHNLLFKRALEATRRCASSRCSRACATASRPHRQGHSRTCCCASSTSGALWHADVGFGQGTLLEPIPFGPGGPYEQSGWVYRVVAEDRLLVLQTATDDGWRDLYAFHPEPVPAIDIEVSNWFTCTHPQSRFVTRLLVTEHGEDGSRTTLSDFSGEMVLSVQTPTGSKREPVARDDVPDLLWERFGLREPEPED